MTASAETPRRLAGEFIRPAVRAVPPEMAQQIGSCHVSLAAQVGSKIASLWRASGGETEICVAVADRDEHDVAIELLVCLGQVLWEKLTPEQLEAYWRVLDAEIHAGVEGEIDEEVLREKRALLGGRFSARSRRRLERYGRASFSATAAEYIHCLWHDVTVRTGPEDLPARYLKRRLQLFARWFPPGRAHRLFPKRSAQRGHPRGG